jgi:hypothetical protein
MPLEKQKIQFWKKGSKNPNFRFREIQRFLGKKGHFGQKSTGKLVFFRDILKKFKKIEKKIWGRRRILKKSEKVMKKPKKVQ